MPRITGKEINDNAIILKEVADKLKSENKNKIMQVRQWILDLGK